MNHVKIQVKNFVKKICQSYAYWTVHHLDI